MEDFLKNRPVLDPKSALVIAAEPRSVPAPVKPPAPANGQPVSPGPFGEIRRETPPASVGAPKPEAAGTAAKGAAAAPALPQAAVQNLKGEHGTKVQTVVERGRVTKIIVTCACGKVTEIACQY